MLTDCAHVSSRLPPQALFNAEPLYSPNASITEQARAVRAFDANAPWIEDATFVRLGRRPDAMHRGRRRRASGRYS